MKKTNSFLLLFLIFFFLDLKVFALEVPELGGPVVDQAHFLTAPGYKAITNALFSLSEKQGIQFQVLIINKLKDESIEGFSIKVVDQWKIGKKGEDRAALFMIAVDDHKMRIEVGRGLEGSLTDLKTKRIINEVSALFKKQDYDNGVALGLALMAQTVGAKISFDPQSIKRARHSRPISSSLILFVLVLVIIVFQFIFPNSGGRGGRGGFGGGGFGGGGSSGGGWSGGGGGFSGGGASGDW